MWRQEDELQSMLRESVDRYAAANETTARFRDRRVTGSGWDPACWRTMGELGWTGAVLAEEKGGAALDILQILSLAEAIGRNLIAEPFVASAVIAGTILNASQTPTAHSLAHALASGETVLTLAYQEEIGKIDPAPPLTSLQAAEDGGFILTGRKIFVPAWTGETFLLVSAMLDGEHVVVAVEPGTRGLTADEHRMTDSSFCAHLALDEVRIDAGALLLRGNEATDAITLALARGMLALAAQLEGAALKLLAMTGDYLAQRSQFDKSLASFQSIRHGLVSQHLQIEFAGASWRAAAAALHVGMSVDTAIRISAAKARSADAALGMGKAAIHYHGAFGFTDEADIGLYVNAILRWASWLGNAEAHRQRARALSKKRQAE